MLADDFMNFNTADKSADKSLIPSDTRARVRLTIQPGQKGPDGFLSESKNGLYFLTFEATIVGGPHDRRKFWQRLLIGSANGELTEGQAKGVEISRRLLRSMVEALYRISPVDDSAEATEKRRIKSLSVLDGIELDILIGVEKSKDPAYDDKNTIKRVFNPLKEERAPATVGRPPSSASMGARSAAAPPASKWGGR